MDSSPINKLLQGISNTDARLVRKYNKFLSLLQSGMPKNLAMVRSGFKNLETFLRAKFVSNELLQHGF